MSEVSHRQFLRDGIKVGQDRCLEIGALTAPLLPRISSNIFYADRLSVDGLRQQFSWDRNFPFDQLVHIDFVLEKNKAIKNCVRGTFDCVLACHVGEHVPNFIGWLQEIQQILRPRG